MNYTITPEIAYVTGFLIGDGNLSKSYLIRAVEENKNFAEYFAGVFSEAFKSVPKIYFDSHNNSFVIYKYSKEIWEFFVKQLNIPNGTKSRTVRTPVEIMKSKESIKSAFLSGIFDAEGTVTNYFGSHNRNGYLKIQFKVCNKELAKEVFELLKSLDCIARLYEYSEFSLISIHGKNNCRVFREKIGFKHPTKNDKLNRLL